MHITYKICVNQLFIISVRLLVLKFLGSQKLCVDFRLCGVLVHLTPALFKGQLYLCISLATLIGKGI